MCGPLDHEDAVISDERFNQNLVSYDAFIENPSILSDPNLVFRLDGRQDVFCLLRFFFLACVT
jgi:hypothetical protein